MCILAPSAVDWVTSKVQAVAITAASGILQLKALLDQTHRDDMLTF